MRKRKRGKLFLLFFKDDGTPYIDVSEFTEEIYMNLIDTLLQNRGPDLDVLKKEWLVIKSSSSHYDTFSFQSIVKSKLGSSTLMQRSLLLF